LDASELDASFAVVSASEASLMETYKKDWKREYRTSLCIPAILADFAIFRDRGYWTGARGDSREKRVFSAFTAPSCSIGRANQRSGMTTLVRKPSVLGLFQILLVSLHGQHVTTLVFQMSGVTFDMLVVDLVRLHLFIELLPKFNIFDRN